MLMCSIILPWQNHTFTAALTLRFELRFMDVLKVHSVVWVAEKSGPWPRPVDRPSGPPSPCFILHLKGPPVHVSGHPATNYLHPHEQPLLDLPGPGSEQCCWEREFHTPAPWTRGRGQAPVALGALPGHLGTDGARGRSELDPQEQSQGRTAGLLPGAEGSPRNL